MGDDTEWALNDAADLELPPLQWDTWTRGDGSGYTSSIEGYQVAVRKVAAQQFAATIHVYVDNNVDRMVTLHAAAASVPGLWDAMHLTNITQFDLAMPFTRLHELLSALGPRMTCDQCGEKTDAFWEHWQCPNSFSPYASCDGKLVALE